MTEEKNEITLDGLKAMMKEAEAYENALENGEISPEQAIDDLFEKYPIKINSNILNQIKEHTLKRVRLFFIVGKNTNLAGTVATCIFTAYKWVYDPAVIEIPLDTEENNYIRTEMTFKKHSYIGWDNTEIKEHLFLSKEPLINHFKKDNMLFLRGINDTKILERLADTVTVEIWCHGVLVINVPSMDVIPQGLSGKFGIIDLEAGNKDTPQQIKLLRGKKEYYAKPGEFNSFLLDIIKKYKNITLDKKANMAISQMKGRELFLKDKGTPLYKKSTIKKMLSALNNTKKIKGKS